VTTAGEQRADVVILRLNTRGGLSTSMREIIADVLSGRIVLPRNDRLQGQIVGLERRTSAVGRDTISHPDRGHDDVANADAGAAALSKRGGYDKSMRWVSGDNDREDPRSNRNLKVLDKPGSEPRVGKSYWRERKPESS
jgi:hypothetical protein